MNAPIRPGWVTIHQDDTVCDLSLVDSLNILLPRIAALGTSLFDQDAKEVTTEAHVGLAIQDLAAEGKALVDTWWDQRLER